MKTTKLLMFALFAGALISASCSNNQSSTTADAEGMEEMTSEMSKSGDMTVDLSASTIGWMGEMLGMYSHDGVVSLESASLTMKDGGISGGNFVVDLSSIAPMDENYGEDNPKEKLIGHLSSPDFFDVPSHPTASFTITGVDGDKVMGDLTVKGVTNAETVEGVVVTETEDGCTVSGKLSFDRTKYGVSWAHPIKENILSDDIKLDVMLVASM